MKHEWLSNELRPDHVLALRLRAGHERDLVRDNRSLSIGECICRISVVNNKYSALIEEEMRREVLQYASVRGTVRIV
jgi:hypothetical protein